MALRNDILFTTGRFNLSKVGSHFINDCCFGEDFVSWIRDRLSAAGYTVDEPYQEDWGWAVELRHDSRNYFVGASGTSNEEPARPDYGEWHVFVDVRQSLKDRLLRKVIDNPLSTEIELLLKGEADFENVRRDDS